MVLAYCHYSTVQSNGFDAGAPARQFKLRHLQPQQPDCSCRLPTSLGACYRPLLPPNDTQQPSCCCCCCDSSLRKNSSFSRKWCRTHDGSRRQQVAGSCRVPPVVRKRLTVMLSGKGIAIGGVRPPICFHFSLRTNRHVTDIFHVYVVYEHNSSGIKIQG